MCENYSGQFVQFSVWSDCYPVTQLNRLCIIILLHEVLNVRFRGGRTSGTRAELGYDAVDVKLGTTDKGKDSYYGWGTHHAGIAAGIYSGVAKDANLYSVRVLKTSGAVDFGDWEMIIDGIDHVSSMHDERSSRYNYITLYN